MDDDITSSKQVNCFQDNYNHSSCNDATVELEEKHNGSLDSFKYSSIVKTAAFLFGVTAIAAAGAGMVIKEKRDKDKEDEMEWKEDSLQ